MVHPSGTFYFDTCVFFVLANIYFERILRSQIREGVFSTCVGVCSVHQSMPSAQCMGGGGKGLIWILPEQELPKVSLKCDKVCQIRYDAVLQCLWFYLMSTNALTLFERNLPKYLEGPLKRQKCYGYFFKKLTLGTRASSFYYFWLWYPGYKKLEIGLNPKFERKYRMN